MTCAAIRQLDEMWCRQCGLRWAINDTDPPACPRNVPADSRQDYPEEDTMPEEEKTVTITRDQLADALQRWDAESKANTWPDRDDAERFRDNADYLIGILEGR